MDSLFVESFNELNAVNTKLITSITQLLLPPPYKMFKF